MAAKKILLRDDFKELNEYMDFSDYDKNHKNYDVTNKKF